MKKAQYPKPVNFSKSHIDHAGKILSSKNAKPEEYEKAFSDISAWRASHLYPMNTFRTTLMRKTRAYKNPVIAQRLKRMPTIIAKLNRHNAPRLSTMQDVGGLRAIVHDLEEVYELKNYYEHAKLPHRHIGTDDYIAKPKSDGYRSVHLVYEYHGMNKIAKKYDGSLIEVQIRTKLQHAWATAVEVAGIMQNEKLKNDEGDEDLLRFFRFVSYAFEYIEFLDDGEKFVPKPTRDPLDIYKEIVRLDHKYKIIERLMVFSQAMNFIDTNKIHKNVKYFILKIDPISKQVEITGYKGSKYHDALKKYAELEKNNKNSHIDQVLVSVGSLKKLKIAYPNYFADMTEFVNKIQIIHKNIDNIKS